MKEVDINIGKAFFPSNEIPESEKDNPETGAQIGRAIEYEWFYEGGSTSKFYSQRNEFHRRRLYARAEQSVGNYKDEIAVDGDLSHLNLDWTNIHVIPKFVDIVVNGMSNRLFTVKAKAQDATSIEKRNKYQENIEAEMVAKDLLFQIQDDFGINTFSNDPYELPESEQELTLRMQLDYKDSIEIANESAINTIFQDNKFQDLKKRVDYDQTVLGVAFAKQEFRKGDGIKMSYVDPSDMVWSYTEDPNFKDCFYWGEVKTVPKTELRKIDPTLEDEDIDRITQFNQAWYDRYERGQQDHNTMFSSDSATLLFFNYKMDKRFVYKKRILEEGGSRMIEREGDFNAPEDVQEEKNFEVVEKTIEVWYEGVKVMGSDIMLKWEVSKNMIRPKSASQKALPNYVGCAPRMYKGSIQSLVQRMIPFADQIQLTHLKLQQVSSRVVPDGVYIDADGLHSIDLGNGQEYNPSEALKLYFQTGSVVGRSFNEDNEFNNAKVPIQELNKSSGNTKISTLISLYNHYLNMIRDVTGLNEARDGSSPDPNSLVGLQKIAALNSNTATRHILDAGLDMTRDLAEAVSLRISDIIEHAPHREEFVTQIGKNNVDLLDEISHLYLHDFGIFIEVSPDAEERENLEANIQIALSRDSIDLEDAIDIREIKNVKLANQMLKLRRKRKEQRLQEAKVAEQQMQAQINQQSQQMAAQMAMQKQQAETQSKLQLAKSQALIDIERMRGEASVKSELMQLEFQMNMQLKGMDVKSLTDREEMKENRKDERITLNNEQQSKLIEQRKKNLPPVDFESSYDSLDGFGLEQFSPR